MEDHREVKIQKLQTTTKIFKIRSRDWLWGDSCFAHLLNKPVALDLLLFKPNYVILKQLNHETKMINYSFTSCLIYKQFTGGMKSRQAGQKSNTPYPFLCWTDGRDRLVFEKIVFCFHFLGHEDRILGGTGRHRPSPFQVIGECWFIFNVSLGLGHRACRSNI